MPQIFGDELREPPREIEVLIAVPASLIAASAVADDVAVVR